MDSSIVLDTNIYKGFIMTELDKMLIKLIKQGKVLSFRLNNNGLMTFKIRVFYRDIEHKTYNKQVIDLVVRAING